MNARDWILTSTEIGKPINLEITIRAGVGAVLGNDKAVGAQCLPCVASENIALNQNLVITSAVDGLVQEVLVQVVVDVLMTEAASGATSTRIPPIVVMIGDVKVTSINIPQSIAVADQRALPVVVEIVPGDSNPVGSANNVQLSIVVVRADLDGDLGAELCNLSGSNILAEVY